MSLRDDLIAARALIADEANWGKSGSIDPAQGRYCAAVACNDFPAAPRMFEALRRAIPDDFPRKSHFGVSEVFDFNDAPSTTHADILALFDRAIEAAQ